MSGDKYINKIICGDSLKVMRDFPDEFVDAVIADPPFGIGKQYINSKEQTDTPELYWEWLKPFHYEMMRVLKPGGFFCLFQTQLYYKYFWDWFGDDIHIYIGAKNFVQLRKTPINYAYDPVVMKYKAGNLPLKPQKPKRNVDFFVANTAKWVRETNSLARKHPYPRPIDLMDEIVNNFSLENGIVLDPFAGSGTTIISCIKSGRSYIGIEKEKEYADIISQRMLEVTK